jgi:ribonuclease P protein subunit RPR2
MAVGQRHRGQQKSEITDIVRERIAILLALAGKEVKIRPERARRYCDLVRRLAKRYNVRLSRRDRMRFCKRCLSYWVPSSNVKVRLRKRERCAEYACACGAVAKFPYSKRAGA